MISGPLISSSVGRLIACTCPQKWPLLSPRSRYHLPPGHASSFMGTALFSANSLRGPSCSSSAAKVASSGARTWISSVMFSVKSSIFVTVEIMISPCRQFRLLVHTGFRSFLDTFQLVSPVSLEGAGPVVQRADGIRIRAIELLPAVATQPDQANVSQHPQMLGHRRLAKAQSRHDFANGALLEDQVVENGTSA